ncbi:hypothetical protein [Micromonospora sp. NPDC048830]|uniref:hypothetical protein n=1 Tax=Micromonospora sp. NPDC048830 TaxID=3364257 RepID=UPI003713084F
MLQAAAMVLTAAAAGVAVVRASRTRGDATTGDLPAPGSDAFSAGGMAAPSSETTDRSDRIVAPAAAVR